MIHAYDKTYLFSAQRALGRMFDFAVHDLHYRIEEISGLFAASSAATRLEQGDPAFLAGMSGVEMTYEILAEAHLSFTRVEPKYTTGRSAEYWTGWALAYYQWETSLSFAEIFRCIPISDILLLYEPYHEMDIRQFCDRMNTLYKAAKPDTNLKIFRRNAGLSQRDLAERAGISVRTIQQYEQREKDINKARAESVLKLSRILYCTAEDLLEKVI